jgi:hypothetical protein
MLDNRESLTSGMHLSHWPGFMPNFQSIQSTYPMSPTGHQQLYFHRKAACLTCSKKCMTAHEEHLLQHTSTLSPKHCIKLR